MPKTGPEKCEFRASKSVKKDSKSVKKLKNEPKSAKNGSHLILRNATFAQPSRFELVKYKTIWMRLDRLKKLHKIGKHFLLGPIFERISIEDYHWVNTNDGFSLNFGLNFMNFTKCSPTLEVCNFSSTDPFSKFLVSILSSSI